MIRGSLIATLSLVSSACAFSGSDGTDPGDVGSGGNGDGRGDGSGTKPEPPRCKFTFVDVCSLNAGPALSYQSNTILDTSIDATCPHRIAQGEDQPELCVFYASSVTIAANITVRATGTRPLVFVSSGAISIEGTLAASSARARNGNPEVVGAGGGVVECDDFVMDPDEGTNGGGGGAGGSLSGKGGTGGKGDGGGGGAGAGAAPDPVMANQLTFLRGGCRGQTGAGGNGNTDAGNPGPGGPPGGALYLAASGDLTIAGTGRVAANGGGGKGGGSLTGGGGGGSGGLIVLEGRAVHRLGMIVANGGAGGQGGLISTTTNPPSKIAGNDGSDGEMSGSAAQGGSLPLTAGQGGDSNDAGQRNGRNGNQGNASGGAGGGGGGGAAGFIRILGPSDGAGVLSPPAS